MEKLPDDHDATKQHDDDHDSTDLPAWSPEEEEELVTPPETAPIKDTAREKAREAEEFEFHRVIIKRSDQTKRHPDDTLQFAIEEGVEQLDRPGVSLLLASTAAGLLLTFTVMAAAFMNTVYLDAEPMTRRLMGALVYPLGFIMVIFSGNQLFTEHTATAVYPILDRRISPWRLGRLWILVLMGNLMGAAVGAVLLWWAEPVIHAHDGYVLIGEHLIQFTPSELFVSAVLAGWLMATAAWLVLCTPSTTTQMASVYICTFLIGIGGLHHSIAGSVEIFTAKLIAPAAVSWGAIVTFIIVAVAGNLLGGSLFVAVLNYGHIRETRRGRDKAE